MIYAPEHVVVFIQQYTTRMLLYQNNKQDEHDLQLSTKFITTVTTLMQALTVHVAHNKILTLNLTL